MSRAAISTISTRRRRGSTRGIEIDWVAGISIGAVNAAIFAGNPPHKRVEMLTAFWDMVTSSLPSFPIYPDDHLREWLHEWSAGYVMAAGVPGFFAPRMVSPVFAVPGTANSGEAMRGAKNPGTPAIIT